MPNENQAPVQPPAKPAIVPKPKVPRLTLPPRIRIRIVHVDESGFKSVKIGRPIDNEISPEEAQKIIFRLGKTVLRKQG